MLAGLRGARRHGLRPALRRQGTRPAHAVRGNALVHGMSIALQRWQTQRIRRPAGHDGGIVFPACDQGATCPDSDASGLAPRIARGFGERGGQRPLNGQCALAPAPVRTATPPRARIEPP